MHSGCIIQARNAICMEGKVVWSTGIHCCQQEQESVHQQGWFADVEGQEQEEDPRAWEGEQEGSALTMQ